MKGWGISHSLQALVGTIEHGGGKSVGLQECSERD